MLSNDIRPPVELEYYPVGVSTDKKAKQEQKPIDPIRVAVGQRLAAARELSKLVQEDVAKRFGVNKATVSAWETGRGDPGIFRLRELSKLYKVSTDALLWADAPTIEAMQMAAEFDALTEEQRRTLKAVWMAYITQSAAGGEKLPMAPIDQLDEEKGRQH